MEFCDNCGKILEIKKIAMCSCGFSKEITKEIIISEKIRENTKKAEGIITKEEHLLNNSQNKFPHKCKKCNNEEAEVIEIMTGYGDEANIYLFKCNNCGYTERQAEGSSNK